MESKELASLALYAVALATAAATIALTILENITGKLNITTVVIFLTIGIFCLAVAGINTIKKR